MTAVGESHGSRADLCEPAAGERSVETVVGAGASFAFVGTGILGPDVSTSLPFGAGRGTTLASAGRFWAASPLAGTVPPLVLTVLRLLSSADAAAVFLFASARSCISIVSCPVLATSFALVSLRQARPPANMARKIAADKRECAFIMFAKRENRHLFGQTACHARSRLATKQMQLTCHRCRFPRPVTRDAKDGRWTENCRSSTP